MVSATSDIVSNVSFQNARAKSSRDDQLSISDSFGSLVDSNTAATASSDRLPTTQPDVPAPPARRDDDSASSADQARRDDDRQDAARSADTQGNDAPPAAPARADSRKIDKSAPDDSKTGSKDNAKADGKSGTKDAASKDGDKPAKTDAATVTAEQPVAVTAVAVAIPVPVATTDTTVKAAATPETGGATPPLAIAAAVLKAQTAATEAAAAGTDKLPTTTTTDGEETFAALIASATPTDGKAGAKKAVTTDATAKADTKTKPNGKTEVATTTATQPTDPTVPQKTAADGKTDNVSADGAKPDAAAVTADAAKPAASKAHEQAPDQKIAAPDLGAQINNTTNIPQTQLQPTSAAANPAPQLTATVANNAAVPLNGVAVEIAQSAKAGKSSFDIRLDPAELGRIDVRLEVDRHGNVTSHLTVEKPETLTMLRQDAPQLQRALEQAGLKTNDSGLQFSLRDQSSGQQQQQNGDNSGRNAQRLIISEDESLPAVPAGRGYGRMLGSSTGVDISI